jgi:hypothetical protein
VMAAIVSMLFPVIAGMEKGGAYAFAFFASMMVLQLFFAWKILPETKGKSLEQIQDVIIH